VEISAVHLQNTCVTVYINITV